jgi:DNA-binding IclR family transcriptional regulator
MPAQPNLSLGRGFRVLGALCGSDGPLGTRELARRLGDEPTRVNRMLGTLRELGLVEQDAQQRYRPGPGIHLLAAQCLRGSGLLAAAMPELAALRGESRGVALGVLWQGQVAYLVHASPGRPLAEGISAHALFPAAQSSIGIILSAHAPASDLPQDLVATARRRGWACIDGEAGMRSLAVAIPGAEPQAAPVAGLALILSRPGDLEPHAQALAGAAARIAARLHAG